jgi:ankyrin repeat protein
MAASFGGHVPVVEALIAADSRVEYARREDGLTALLVACERGHVDVVRILLREGADPNQAFTDENAHSPLILASIRGFVQIVDELISAGANVNYARPTGNIEKRFIPGCTAILAACQNGHVDVVRILLRAGADPNQAYTDEYAESPLIKASLKGFVQIVDELISAGANVNYARPNDGCTSLMYATQTGFVDVVRSLLAAGADPRTARHNGLTALDAALHCNHPAIAALLKTKIAELSGST